MCYNIIKMKNKQKTSEIIEKRRYPRVPIKIEFFCHDSEPKEGDGLLHFHSSNLSCGGVYLTGNTGFTVGNILHMDFKLPDNEQKISVSGVIVRKDEEGMGIRFLTLTIDEFERVENFVNDQL